MQRQRYFELRAHVGEISIMFVMRTTSEFNCVVICQDAKHAAELRHIHQLELGKNAVYSYLKPIEHRYERENVSIRQIGFRAYNILARKRGYTRISIKDVSNKI